MNKSFEETSGRYWKKVLIARAKGYSDKAIVNELQRERFTIMPRCIMKQATLATDRNIYKKREAARAAQECIAAIDKICNELAPKETTV